jgi:hypothetical protein
MAALLGLAVLGAPAAAATGAGRPVASAAPSVAPATDATALVGAPLSDAAGDALSEIVPVDPQHGARHGRDGEVPADTPPEGAQDPSPRCALDAHGLRAHPPTAPPRSA